MKKVLYKSINLLFFIVSLLFIYFLINLNIIPNKYLIMGISFLIGLFLLFFYIIWWSKNKNVIKIIISIFSMIISIALIVCIIFIYKTDKFLDNINNTQDMVEYNIVTLNTFSDNYEDLADKTISYLDENTTNISAYFDFNYTDKIEDNLSDLGDNLLNGNVSAIVVESNIMESLDDEIDNFEDSTKVIKTFEVKNDTSKIETSDVKISDSAFILYISGIDQYGSISSTRGRSDVNMLVVVNPKTSQILLVNTPRDYYVTLHSKKALDKLTHAGVYGINESVTTMEDLYDIDINYYLKVNFNTVVNLVDSIGNVNVYSDLSFVPTNDKTCTIVKGNNSLTGRCALAYARERKHYLTGDRHRGQNQQEIIEAIIDKVSNSKTLLTNYSSILDDLSGNFMTNIGTDTITSFIKYQLTSMPNWTVESISVNGSDAYDYTYSYGTSRKLYVMVPTQSSVTAAKEKISEVLNSN